MSRISLGLRFLGATFLAASCLNARDWAAQAKADAAQDFTVVAYDGISPNKMVCDTTLRELPDGSWALYFLAGGDSEPSPKNYTGLLRSTDRGHTWSKLEAVDVGFPREGKTIGQGPTELISQDGRLTLFFATHSHHWRNDWRSWFMHSTDAGRTWTKPEPLPGRLALRTFIRAALRTRDGRIVLPFQHYLGPVAEQDKAPLDRALTNPRNGVLISADGGKSWSEHGDIRLTTDDRYFGWAEPTLAELSDGRLVMLIRADKLGGVLYRAISPDGGRTWPESAEKSDIPNPGSKATLHQISPGAIALLNNPNPAQRTPLALWISFDDMQTWAYQRVIVPQSSDGPKGRLNYPEGFVSADRQYLNLAYDDNRHRAVVYLAKLPPLESSAKP